MPGLRLLGFIDAGWLGNNSPNGTNKPSSDRLASVGLGLRYVAGAVRGFRWTMAACVSGSRVPLASTRRHRRKATTGSIVNLSVRF